MSKQLPPKYTPSYVEAGQEDVLKTREVQKYQSFSFVIPTTQCNWKNSTLLTLRAQPSKSTNR